MVSVAGVSEGSSGAVGGAFTVGTTIVGPTGVASLRRGLTSCPFLVLFVNCDNICLDLRSIVVRGNERIEVQSASSLMP